MMRAALKITIFAFLLLAAAAPHAAQAQICAAEGEVILTLRKPMFGHHSVWSTSYGSGDVQTAFKAGVPLPGGTVMAAGQVLDPETNRPAQIILAELNYRGRAMHEASYAARPGEDPVALLLRGNQYIMLSNIFGGTGNRARQVRLSWYNREGIYLKDAVLRDNDLDYEAQALVPAAEGGGFVVVLQASGRGDNTERHGLLKRYNDSGALVWQRAYLPGAQSRLYGLAAIDDRNYIAAGDIVMEDGRTVGWAVLLGHDGALRWQRSFPRGAHASLRLAAVARAPETGGARDYEYLLLGEARPVDGGPAASWLLALDGMGGPRWQRYYRRADTTFSPRAIHSHEDGRTTLLLNAQPDDDDYESAVPEHIRLLTLSPYGELIGDEPYYEGLRSRAYGFGLGANGERVVIAAAEIPPRPPAPPGLFAGGSLVYGPAATEDPYGDDDKAPEHKGWVLVATALEPYDNPCLRNMRR